MSKAAESSLLDPVHLNRINDLALLAKVVVDGAMPGMHRSLRQGRGNEFFQYRAYEQGEDLKVVDWKVYAKRSELVAKTYQDTNFSVFIVIDSSASMGYTGENTPYSKLRYASMLEPAWLTWLTAKGIKSDFLVTERKPSNGFDRLRGSGHLQRVRRDLSLKAKGTSQHEKAWDQLANVLPARTMVVFLSDFLESEDTLSDRLRFSASSHYESLCLQILDPEELDLPEKEALLFTEMEGNRQISTSPNAIRQGYQEEMRDFIDLLNDKISSVSAEFETFLSNQDLGHALRRFLGIRNRMK